MIWDKVALSEAAVMLLAYYLYRFLEWAIGP